MNYSRDGGATWQPSEIRVNAVTPAASPQIAASGALTYLAWVGTPAGIYFDSSSDGGSTWRTNDTRLDTTTTGTPESVQIAASGSSVFVSWEDSGNVYLNYSTDWGVTWQVTERQLNTAGAAASDPQLLVEGSLVSTVWQDSRSPGQTDIYCNYSSDGGTTWLSTDLPVNTNPTGAFPSLLSAPRIAASDSAVFVTWSGLVALQPPSTVQFNIPFGLQPYGSGSVGSGGQLPVLAGTGQPTPGEFVTLDVSNGLGGATAVLAIGALEASQISLPLLGGTLLVLPSLTVPFLLDGSGAAALPLALPDVPTLRGLPQLPDARAGSGRALRRGDDERVADVDRLAS